ncbi:YbhB/YbcL family Raf kinase inhibitor-like protein [Patescibacteria group bacterium]|nr:YbhB/YbcL family Raf kinase inhibitor-like protein [Patescibacteria group bacterium]MBU1123059.1 YbhB/YbcL family Raf kinase inhibitor-like protein [Patescibacteria group bacterium]
MELTAPAFANNGKIPSKFTCDGENINPALSFDDVPAQAQSLVLIMDDPDVPKSIREDGMWDHWVVFNIPPHTQGVNENGQPDGVAGSNTRGDLSYGGPCPPDREHRYFFKLYALDSELDLPEGSTKAEVEEGMRDHIIGEAELVGLYKRISE